MIIAKIRKFLFPNSWAQCNPPTDAERKAQWRIRHGHHLAEQELKKARIAQALDYRVCLNQASKPRLP